MQSSLIISLTGVTASGFTLCGQPPEPPLPALQNFLKYSCNSGYISKATELCIMCHTDRRMTNLDLDSFD
ncbi:hypothetical protein NQ318_019378 [Aromia moschata]|uniref:Secreted protein n=1 Tax=Aromia moschata TaxID=1265417 RepID=A0AAV8XMP9_9CUCU|nr:hypothetical protein NQ318_019378 [Aromia moschata]